MNRPTELRLLHEAMSVRTPRGEGEDTKVDVERYLDERAFATEREREFKRRLNLVAHGSEVPEPGSFMTINVVGVPVLIVRDDDGKVRAFLNVCRHRGATVELREKGRCKSFVCPYHAWTYGRDGELRSVRHKEGFPSLDMNASGLVELAGEERAGLVWVCPDPSVKPTLDKDAVALLEEVATTGPARPRLYARESRVWKANWKLIVEGGLESYHFKVAHRSTVGPLFMDTGSLYELMGDHFRMVLPRITMGELHDKPESSWRLLEHANVLYTFAPNATVLMQDGHYALVMMQPLGPRETRIDVATVGRAPSGDSYSEKAEAFLRQNHEFTVQTLHEDFTIAEQIQAGLATGANESLRLASFEGALRDFHAGLARRLG